MAANLTDQVRGIVEGGDGLFRRRRTNHKLTVEAGRRVAALAENINK